MTPMEAASKELAPKLLQLTNYLEGNSQAEAAAFFRSIHHSLGTLRDDGDLFDVFLARSTTACQHFALDPYAARVADGLLLRAQQLASALSADDDTPQ